MKRARTLKMKSLIADISLVGAQLKRGKIEIENIRKRSHHEIRAKQN